MKKIVYVFQKTPNESLKSLFKALHQDIKLITLTKQLFKITYHECVEDEPLDYEAIRSLILTDFQEDLIIFETYERSLSFLDEESLIHFIQSLPYNTYDLMDLIKYMIKRNVTHLESIKKKLASILGQEMIDTLLALASHNMNISIAAKHLYLHRNTMHYRIDKVIEKTGIDVKTFQGLAIFYLLFG